MSGYGSACISCGGRHDHKPGCRHAEPPQPVSEYIEFRGRRWFVADVQDDEQHMHLTIVPAAAGSSIPGDTP